MRLFGVGKHKISMQRHKDCVKYCPITYQACEASKETKTKAANLLVMITKYKFQFIALSQVEFHSQK